MKDKTKVKARNVGKVAELKIKDPNITYTEIQEKTWLARNTVNKSLKELNSNWTKDETIAYIVTSAKNRIKRVSALFDRYVEQIEIKEELDNRDVALAKDIVKDDMARVTVLWWDLTKDDGWFTLEWLSKEQLLDIAMWK